MSEIAWKQEIKPQIKNNFNPDGVKVESSFQVNILQDIYTKTKY